MKKLLALRRNERGAAAIEMAIVVPVLTVFLWGIFQVGVALESIAGMQHGLGEGARLATLCLNPQANGTCTIPTNDAVKQRISDRIFGTGIGTFTVADPVDGAGFKDLSVRFEMPMNFLFFNGPSLSITRGKRVYLANIG